MSDKDDEVEVEPCELCGSDNLTEVEDEDGKRSVICDDCGTVQS